MVTQVSQNFENWAIKILVGVGSHLVDEIREGGLRRRLERDGERLRLLFHIGLDTRQPRRLLDLGPCLPSTLQLAHFGVADRKNKSGHEKNNKKCDRHVCVVSCVPSAADRLRALDARWQRRKALREL